MMIKKVKGDKQVKATTIGYYNGVTKLILYDAQDHYDSIINTICAFPTPEQRPEFIAQAFETACQTYLSRGDERTSAPNTVVTIRPDDFSCSHYPHSGDARLRKSNHCLLSTFTHPPTFQIHKAAATTRNIMKADASKMVRPSYSLDPPITSAQPPAGTPSPPVFRRDRVLYFTTDGEYLRGQVPGQVSSSFPLSVFAMTLPIARN